MIPRINKGLQESFLLMIALVLLIPFYLVIVNTFKTKADILSNPLSLPVARLTWVNLQNAAVTASFNIFKAYATSVWITGLSVFLVIVIGSMMSYVIARNQTKSMKFLYLFLLSGLMIPPQVILIPLVQILRSMGLMFKAEGLILFNVAFYIPFTVFVYTGFIRTISPQLDESAKMDGANSVRIFWQIIFPLIKSCTASVIIFECLWIWNDFVNPLIILGSGKGYTVTTGIYTAVGKYNTNWDQVFALVFLASLPIFVLYLLMQKQFISGLTEGGIKG